MKNNENIECQTILVTGASGYMASWVVKMLLQQGHKVHASVRSFEDLKKVSHLLKFQENHPQQLKLFEADLLSENSFSKALMGCDIVIHTASPYFLNKPKDPIKELITPAVKGTQFLLEDVNKTETVKRVVLTSSIVSLFTDAKECVSRPGHLVNEQNTNINQQIDYNPYALSKTMAEKKAWLMQSQQNQWSLVTVHPGAIFGPSLSNRNDPTSVKMLLQFLDGSFKSGVPNLKLGLVDVRDTAELHLKAALSKTAEGKYIAVSETLSLLEIAQKFNLQQFDLTDQLPKKYIPKILIWLIAPFIGMNRSFVSNNVGFDIQFDNQRSIKAFNFVYRSAETMLNDHVKQLLDCGLI